MNELLKLNICAFSYCHEALSKAWTVGVCLVQEIMECGSCRNFPASLVYRIITSIWTKSIPQTIIFFVTWVILTFLLIPSFVHQPVARQINIIVWAANAVIIDWILSVFISNFSARRSWRGCIIWLRTFRYAFNLAERIIIAGLQMILQFQIGTGYGGLLGLFRLSNGQFWRCFP